MHLTDTSLAARMYFLKSTFAPPAFMIVRESGERSREAKQCFSWRSVPDAGGVPQLRPDVLPETEWFANPDSDNTITLAVCGQNHPGFAGENHPPLR